MKNIKNYLFPLFVAFILIFNFSSCKDDDVYEDWRILNEKWLETHKNDPGFVQTESGLCYKVIHQGIMRRPNTNSWIIANYSGMLIDSTEFDSGEWNYPLANAITGWQEGIPKMNGGGKYIFYVPSSLGYGEDGQGDIAPHSTLIFEVELIHSY